MTPAAPDMRDLTSWKEIAAHLGVSVRTAQMWEKARGLPVRRLPGGNRVIALPSELDQWKLSAPAPIASQEAPDSADTAAPPVSSESLLPPHYRTFAVALVATLILAAAGFAMIGIWRKPPNPFSYRVLDRQIAIFDSNNLQLWSLPYPDDLVTDDDYGPRTKVSIEDLNGDGTNEVIIFPHLKPLIDRVNEDLFCYSAKGEVLWKYRVEKSSRTNDAEYFPPYGIRAFVVLPPDASGHRRVAVSASHYRLFPSRVALLDHSGRLLHEYWHGGHLMLLRVAGNTLLAGGVTNRTNEATLVVLNPDAMTGASLEDVAHQIKGFGTGVEIARYTFPRSCLNQKSRSMSQVTAIDVTGNEIAIHTVERDSPTATLIWTFDPAWHFRAVTESSAYTKARREANLDSACLAREDHTPRLLKQK